MTLCVITPRLPPAMDGIGDYCRQLWLHSQGTRASGSQEMAVTNSMVGSAPSVLTDEPWHFLVMDGAEESRPLWPEVQITQIHPSMGGLVAQLEQIKPSVVLLQYVGYGYASNGAPQFLGDALAMLQRRHSQIPIVIMFHETFSRGKPWQKVFWQTRTQKRCVRQLLKVASTIVTSMQANLDSLRLLDAEIPISIIPIGPSFNIMPSARRNWRQILVFGKQYSRLFALRKHAALLKMLDSLNAIDSIVLAGQRDSDNASADEVLLSSLALNAKVVCCTNFSSNSPQPAIQQCGLSLMHTQSTNILKSTSFQLAAQLGQVAITVDERAADPPFVAGEHYLSYNAGSMLQVVRVIENQAELEKISTACLALGKEYLSWTNIGKRWSDLLTTLVCD